MDSLSVKVKYFDKKYETFPGEKLPRIIKNPKGDWLDLYAAADLELDQFEFALLPLGVAIELPRGFEAFTAPRGSTFKNWGVLQVNSWGVIDNSYCGDGDEWFIPILAMRKTSIKRGDKMFQFRIIASMPKVDLLEVAELGNEDRGGHGSTGTK